MTISEAKDILEREIILWDGVIGIGVVAEKTLPEIEVSIDRNNYEVQAKLQSFIGETNWYGYTVKVHYVDVFRPHDS